MKSPSLGRRAGPPRSEAKSVQRRAINGPSAPRGRFSRRLDLTCLSARLLSLRPARLWLGARNYEFFSQRWVPGGREGEHMGKIIGIDLGTTNSVVSIMEGGEPK
ncbi:MAG: hypothetical protein ACO3JL_18120, partial [Myxococcota bacterium]